MSVKRKTIFMDIDGTIAKHQETLSSMLDNPIELNDGVLDKIIEWRSKDYYLVITTARPEGTRSTTVRQLAEAGIFYDQLVMGLPTGKRIILNDKKPNGSLTAGSVNLERNEGFSSLKF